MKQWLGATNAEDVGKFYDGIYDRSNGAAFIEDREPILNLLRKYTKPRSFNSLVREFDLLDAGCGSGQFIKEVLSKGILIGDEIRCTGAEISDRAFNASCQLLMNQKVPLYKFRIEELFPKLSNNFDYITCLGVIEHTMNPSACFASLMGCLRADGILLITVPIQFNDCFSALRNEPNQRTNERFATIEEWLEYFGNQHEAYHLLSDHVAIIYRKGNK